MPVFANAVHIYVGDELDYTRQPSRRVDQDPWEESVQPILDAELSRETTADHDLGDGLRLVSTPGHTPGHASLVVETGSTDLVITGDLIDHPFQCAKPQIAQGSDWNPLIAGETRQGFLDHYAGRDSLIAGTHFPEVPVGRIEPKDHAWTFRSVRADHNEPQRK